MNEIKNILLVIALVFVTSCSKSTLDDDGGGLQTPENAISFSSGGGSAQTADLESRTGIVNSFRAGSRIGVYGYFLDDGSWNSTPTAPDAEEIPNFMYNEELIMGTTSAWIYFPLKYWSNDPNDRYKFFGYYPYNNSQVTPLVANDDAGYPSFSFVSEPNIALDEQVDFLISQTEVLGKNTNGLGVVPMNFKHALSKIRVSALASTEDLRHKSKFTVKSITINAPTEATLQTDSSGGSWIDHAKNEDYVFTHDPSVEISSESKLLVGGSTPDDALLLIPRKGEITATIVYDYSYELRPEDRYRDTIKNVTTVITLDDELVMGSSYHYSLDFSLNAESLKPYIDLETELSDWGESFDITTEVIYTYLHVEKAEFTLVYLSDDPVNLSVYFTTNAPADSISVEFVRADGELSTGDPREQNTVSVDKANNVVNCTFYPDLSYDVETIRIKAGIISTTVKINLVPQEPYLLMNLEDLTDYLKVPVTKVMYSNSYFLNPSEQYTRKYYIPINQQIEHMYGTEGTDILNDNSWKVKLYAYDNRYPVNNIAINKEKDTLSDDGNIYDCFSLVLPNDYDNYGNMLVAVTDASDVILWTWHFWITDYNPYMIYATVTTPEIVKPNVEKYASSQYGGAFYRNTLEDFSYVLDRNVGAIDDTYIGHGGLGGTGWLVYQQGRVSPILGHTARFADGNIYTTIKHNVDSEGQVSQKTSIQNPNTIYFSPTGKGWCSDENVKSKVWNDLSLAHPEPDSAYIVSSTSPYYQKSIYDPSPLGFMLPPLKATSVGSGDFTIEDEGLIYKMDVDNKIFASINIDATNGSTPLSILSTFRIWSNSSYSDNLGGALKFAVYTTAADAEWQFDTPRTLGAPVRCISQFQIPNP